MRDIVKVIRGGGGLQGWVVGLALDASGVFSEPGIARLMDDVEKRQESGGKRTRKLSTLLSAAAEAAIVGRLDDLR